MGLPTRLRRQHRGVSLVWADGDYTGGLVDRGRHKLALTLEVVKRTDDRQGFVVLSRRWVAEDNVRLVDAFAPDGPGLRDVGGRQRSDDPVADGHADEPTAERPRADCRRRTVPMHLA
ncbi:hypothetical protein ACFWJM_34150 [Streptomyces sp. NPDC127077]|uniref:hypothetical protein n=1 Tax=Streptomyces sp. NPDC127077 TaxID=3347131 RepID=UPI00366439A3